MALQRCDCEWELQRMNRHHASPLPACQQANYPGRWAITFTKDQELADKLLDYVQRRR